MLVSLRIRNLALVEELEWQPGPGFVAITGESFSPNSRSWRGAFEKLQQRSTLRATFAMRRISDSQ